MITSKESTSRVLSKGHVSFWDLQLLEDGLVGDAQPAGVEKEKNSTGKGKAYKKGRARPMGLALAAEDHSTASSSSRVSTPAADGKINKLTGPMQRLPPHKVVEDPTGRVFTPRAVAWSVGGGWCVVAGDEGTAYVMRRWDERPLV